MEALIPAIIVLYIWAIVAGWFAIYIKNYKG